jgi:hypothetical protein
MAEEPTQTPGGDEREGPTDLNTQLAALVRQAVLEALAAGPALPAPAEGPALLLTTTPKLGLKMPALDDPALITDLNDNMVILDESVTATQAVTLTNKTLDAPIINNPTITGWTNAQHTHLNAAGAGTLDGAAIVSGAIGTGFLLRESGPALTDPIVRDQLSFGAKPAGAADTVLLRTGANALTLGGSPVITQTAGDARYLQSATAATTYVPLAGGNVLTGHLGPTTTTTRNLGSTSNRWWGVYCQDVQASGSILLGTAPAAGGALRLDNNAQIGWMMAGGTGLRSLVVNTADNFVFAGNAGPGGNVGIGVPPAAWGSTLRVIQMGQVGSGRTALLDDGSVTTYLTQNTYHDGTNWRAVAASFGSLLSLSGGGVTPFTVQTAPSVAAGAVQAFTTRMSVNQQGTLTLTPDAGQDALSIGTLNAAIQNTAGAVLFKSAGNAVAPYPDNAYTLGAVANRWTVVYAVTGAINTSTVEYKEDITPLDPAACAQAVLDTDWVAFEYLPPALPPGRPGETVAQSTARVSAHSRMVQETAFARRQNGYVLGSPSHRISPLFGLSDRKSASPQADLAVVACALQDALRRIAILEGAPAA